MCIIIIENKNCTIISKVFVCKIKYFVHIVIYVTIPKGATMGGVETRGTGKLDKTSTMRRIGFPHPKSYKVEGNLLTPSITIQIL
jgi:hypothetical protein